MSDDDYVDAFPQGFRNTVRFLVMLRRVAATEAPDFAMQAWAQVWRYRHSYDPTKAALQTWANLIAWREFCKNRKLLESQLASAAVPLPKDRYEKEDSSAMMLPAEMISSQNDDTTELDARMILRKMEGRGFVKPAARLRSFYLEGRRPSSGVRLHLPDDLRKARRVCGL